MILGGLMMPLSVLPHVMKKIALLLPTSHAMNAFRGLAYGYTPDFNPFWSIVILLSSIILSFSLALRLFNWQPQETERKKGAIWGFLVIVPYLVGIILIH
jgi:ABC-2 type transport system permease protein